MACSQPWQRAASGAPILALASCPPAAAAGVRAALLAQRDAVTNWAAFKAANNIQGWDEAAPDVCSWSGVNCTKDTREVFRL